MYPSAMRSLRSVGVREQGHQSCLAALEPAALLLLLLPPLVVKGCWRELVMAVARGLRGGESPLKENRALLQ